MAGWSGPPGSQARAGKCRTADGQAQRGRFARSGRGIQLVREARPQVVFLAAAKVGGIVANNTLRAEFIYDNLIIATNVIQAAHINGAEKADVSRLVLHLSQAGARSRCARIRC